MSTSDKKTTYTSEEDKEVQHFLQGYRQFRSHYFCEINKNSLYQKLVEQGQNPKTMVIACSDSRVDPSIILGSMPGELFVVRNVANLVPPYDNDPKHHGTSAALEFAVLTLKVNHIIVLGHSHCGGIRALLANTPSVTKNYENSFISSWMDIARSAKAKVIELYRDASIEQQEQVCEEQSLQISLNNLRTFPWINERVNAGTLALHAWRFDLRTGMIQRFNLATQLFEDLVV